MKKVWYNTKAVKQTARWSSGQDASLSRWKHGFDSRTGHQKRQVSFEACLFLLPHASLRGKGIVIGEKYSHLILFWILTLFEI